VPAYNGFNLGIDQRIEDGIDLCAGHAEYMRDAVSFQCTHNELCANLGFLFCSI
jgi:hypothetical protein